MKRRSLLKFGSMSGALALAGQLPISKAQATDTGPIKVGILHSLSGTMAISETSLKDTALMTIADINKNGGVMGRQLQPVVVDPASNWPLFAEKARQLLTQDKCAVVFGCWTSVSRKSVLPVFEELNGLLFYPVQYEGEEMSRNVFYYGRSAESAGHSRRRISDGTRRRQRQALLSARHRLCVSAHDQQDPARVPPLKGCQGCGYLGGLHTVRT